MIDLLDLFFDFQDLMTSPNFVPSVQTSFALLQLKASQSAEPVIPVEDSHSTENIPQAMQVETTAAVSNWEQVKEGIATVLSFDEPLTEHQLGWMLQQCVQHGACTVPTKIDTACVQFAESLCDLIGLIRLIDFLSV